MFYYDVGKFSLRFTPPLIFFLIFLCTNIQKKIIAHYNYFYISSNGRAAIAVNLSDFVLVLPPW